jgi:hypothetical protein
MARQKPRRKTGMLNQRVDPDNRALWQAEADRLGVPLAVWIECVLNEKVEQNRRRRVFEQSYPGRYYEPHTDLGP